jgi:hypothetical protein
VGSLIGPGQLGPFLTQRALRHDPLPFGFAYSETGRH